VAWASRRGRGWRGEKLGLTIPRHLAELGLDWEAPAYSEDDPAGYDAPPLPPLEIEYGPLSGRFEHAAE